MPRAIPKQACIDYLQDLADRLGRTPTETDITEDGTGPSAPAIRAKFGGLPAAQRAAGLEPNRRGSAWTADEALARYRELARRLKRTPTLIDVEENTDGPCVNVYYRLFGDFATVARRCGLRPNVPGVNVRTRAA